MSLRNDYTQTASTAATRRLQSVSKTLAHDLVVVRERAKARGLSGVFASLKAGMLSGSWSRKDNTLTYMLASEDVALNHINYTRILADIRKNNRDWMLVECKSAAMDEIISRRLPRARAQIESEVFARHAQAVESNPAYGVIQALCSDPSIDVKMELVVASTASGTAARAREGFDFFINLDGSVVASPRLQLRISLDQPYEAPAPRARSVHGAKIG